jgi:hypothetical protein
LTGRRPSPLGGLQPIGLGTPLVESLASYFLRLGAQCHLLPRDLARYMVGAAGLDTSSYGAYTQVVSRGRSTMNGPDDAAEKWAGVLSTLTGQTDLELMTMVPWRGRVSSRGLMSPVRRFCSSCFWDWQEADEPVRELLLWTLTEVTLCPTHNVRLRDRCQHDGCRRVQPHLGSIARPGRCFWCDESLASPLIAEESDPARLTDRAWARFVADRVGEVLADSARARSKSMPTMTIMMTSIIEGAGGTMALSARTGVGQGTVSGWRYHVPTLGYLLHLAATLEVRVSDLMRGDPALGSLPTSAPLRGRDHPVRKRAARQRVDWGLVEHQLRMALKAAEALPQRLVMAQIGIDPSAARKRYPALCRALSVRAARARGKRARYRAQRHKADIRAAVVELSAQGVYASRRRVEAALPHLSLREPALGAAWHDTLLSASEPTRKRQSRDGGSVG